MVSESVLDASDSGDRKRALEALRHRLAAEIDACESGRDLAALSRQLTLVLAEIQEFAPPQQKKKEGGGSFLDRLAERDENRGPAA